MLVEVKSWHLLSWESLYRQQSNAELAMYVDDKTIRLYIRFDWSVTSKALRLNECMGNIC